MIFIDTDAAKDAYNTIDMNSINKRVVFFVLTVLNMFTIALLIRNLILVKKWKEINPGLDGSNMILMNI